MAANVNIVINAKDRATGTIKGIAGALGNILQVALGISVARLFDRAIQSLKQFAVNAIEATALVQQMQIGVETLIARELRMADAQLSMNQALEQATPLAAAMMDKLADLAIISPYQYESVMNTFRQAMAFGFAADEAYQFTEALLNVAAGTGANNERLQRMAYNLAQVRLQGQVTKLDIRQLALAGFDLVGFLKDLGNQFGVTIEDHKDFNKAIASGELTWEQFAQGFQKYADEYFGGASERMARSLFGLKNTFHDVFALTMPAILGPAAEAVTEYLNVILDKFIQLRDDGTLEEWGQRLKDAFDNYVRPVLDALADLISGDIDFKGFINKLFGTDVRQILLEWRQTDFGQGIANLIDAFHNFKRWLERDGEELIKALKRFFGALIPDVGAGNLFVMITEGILDFTEVLLMHGDDIITTLNNIADAIEEDFWPAMDKLWRFVSEHGPGILAFFASFFAVLKGAAVFTGVAVAFGTIAAAIGNFGAAVGLAIEVIAGGGGLFTVLLGLASVVVAALGPVMALALAVGLLAFTIVELGPKAWESLQLLGQIFVVILFQASIAAQQVITIVWAALLWVWGKIVEFAQGIQDAWTSIWNAIIAIAVTKLVELILTIIGLVNPESFSSKGGVAGRALVSGIVGGIDGGAGRIKRAARRAAHAAYQAALSALGITSPSKLGIEIGANFTTSIAQGIEKTALKPALAAEGVATSMARPLEKGKQATQVMQPAESKSIVINGPLMFSEPITYDQFRALLMELLYG